MKYKGKGIICLKDELYWKLEVKTALTILIHYSGFRIFSAMSKAMEKYFDANSGGSAFWGPRNRSHKLQTPFG